MSTRKEAYIIYGYKFGEDFTKEYWEKDFYDEMTWDKNKPNDKPFFITDGMNGDYTFFGFIQQLSNGFNDEDYEIKEINTSNRAYEIESSFKNLYPDWGETPDELLYYLPHWV